MVWKTRIPWLLAFCAVCFLSAGCGKGGLPTRVPVQGKVTFKGKPLTIGRVIFSPAIMDATQPSRPATATLDKDGVYRVSSFRPNDGLPPGEYRVAVQSYSSTPTESNPKAPFVSRIPEHYSDTETSGLRLVVPTDDRKPITFDIDIH